MLFKRFRGDVRNDGDAELSSASVLPYIVARSTALLPSAGAYSTQAAFTRFLAQEQAGLG